MGLRVYDFTCSAGHTVERFVSADIEEHECECGAMGKRQLAAPRARLEGFTGAFPGAADAWERRRESHMRKEQRNQREHGTYK
jgi:hypothetical protein